MGVATDNDPQHVPSAARLAKTSGAALLAAAVVLVTVVLPAEYGIDPLGAGRALGIASMSQATVAAVPPPPVGDAFAPVQQGAVALYPGEFKVDSREFVLGPYEYIEYKYHLAKDASMFFSWDASGDVIHDFHGDPDGAPASAAQSYDKTPRRKADGSFTAPFSGIHGWFWENPGADSITVKVTTAGFYTTAHEFHFDGTRRPRDVRPLDSIAVADN